MHRKFMGFCSLLRYLGNLRIALTLMFLICFFIKDAWGHGVSLTGATVAPIGTKSVVLRLSEKACQQLSHPMQFRGRCFIHLELRDAKRRFRIAIYQRENVGTLGRVP